MTVEEIINIINTRCESIPQRIEEFVDKYWYAHYFMAEGMLEALRLNNIPIDEISNPDKTSTVNCYEEPYCDEPTFSVSVLVGSRDNSLI